MEKNKQSQFTHEKKKYSEKLNSFRFYIYFYLLLHDMELISECAVVPRESHEQVNIRWVCGNILCDAQVHTSNNNFVQFIIARVGLFVSFIPQKVEKSWTHTN